jgi:hypothetical protein
MSKLAVSICSIGFLVFLGGIAAELTGLITGRPLVEDATFFAMMGVGLATTLATLALWRPSAAAACVSDQAKPVVDEPVFALGLEAQPG